MEDPTAPTAVLTTAAELAALSCMTGPELSEKYLALFGTPPRSRNRDFLRKRLAWRIQELAEGGLSEKAVARIKELGPAALASWKRTARPAAPAAARPARALRDPRLPRVGTVLNRTYADRDHVVIVREHGFEYQGETYGSLSRIARLITATPWNGYVFFLGRGIGKKGRS